MAGHITVVTIDDTPAIRSLLKLVLELEPAITVVGEAGDGQAGIEVVREHAPDVALLDISMPVMDGIEALPSILEASPGTSVVMLTGFGTADIRARCAELGAAGFLDKGVLASSIVAAVRRAAGGGVTAT